MKILIVKLSSIGDVVHTLPALNALRRGLAAGTRIDWLVEEAASPLLMGHPLIDDVIVVKRRGWTKEPRAALATAGLLASREYDAVLDFQGLFKSAVWVMASRAKRKIGFSNSRELSPLVLNERLSPYDRDTHAVERYLRLAEHAGGAKGPAVFDLNVTRADSTAAAAMLKKAGLDPSAPFFAAAPMARWETKLFGARKFSELVSTIHGKTGLAAAIIGGPADRAALDEVRAGAGKAAVNLAGLGGLKELAALMRLSAFAVTVDSAPMHIAAAAGTRVAAVFGPTAPWRTGPYGPGHLVVRRELPCSPCFKRRCPTKHECMEGLDVEYIVERMDEAGFFRQGALKAEPV